MAGGARGRKLNRSATAGAGREKEGMHAAILHRAPVRPGADACARALWAVNKSNHIAVMVDNLRLGVRADEEVADGTEREPDRL
jgi:hypothetical protein